MLGKIVRVLLVIFGAGASFDSVPDLPPGGPLPAMRPALVHDHYQNDRPPLANQLFDNRPQFVSAMARFPSCKALIPQLRTTGVAVEQELARIQKQAEEYPTVHKELASVRYYLHSALWECQKRWEQRHSGITNYATFLREIERWRLPFNEKVCFVTFNYDTMLDEEWARLLGLQIKQISDYAQKNYSLIKLHGSINWGREVDGLVAPGMHNLHTLIDAASGLVITDRYRVVTRYPMYQIENAVVFPALSIPVVNKDEFSCPKMHIDLLLEALPKVSKIITVGWRATETDFLKMLQTKLQVKHPGLMIVSGDDRGATETYNNLTGHMQEAERQPYGRYTAGALNLCSWTNISNGFTGLINNLDTLDTFLRTG